MKLGIVLSTDDPETSFNALRLALFARTKGDDVGVFLIGKGVDFGATQDARFDVTSQARTLLDTGGRILACGTCLKLRNSEGSEICPISSMHDLYELIDTSDRIVSF